MKKLFRQSLSLAELVAIAPPKPLALSMKGVNSVIPSLMPMEQHLITLT